MTNDIAAELDGIDLNDTRRNQRSQQILNALYANSQASINSACGGWNDTQAAYRFFRNPAVEPEAILKPHIQASCQRIEQHPHVIIAQDTTELDYTAHPPKDARCLNTVNRFGLYQQTHLALTPDGLPLGVVGSSHFDRSAQSLGQAEQRKSLPIEQKESFRWLQGYRLASEIAQQCPNTRVVSVADSEADIYDIFTEARDHESRTDFVIRAKQPRTTTEADPDAGPDAYRTVHDTVAASKLRATRSVELSATPKRKARRAELEMRALTIELKAPQSRSELGPVGINVVLIVEANAPDDGTAVRWLLLTNMPIETVAQVEQVVDCYVTRWGIEVYFRILKTGCRVEEIQLETKSRLTNSLAFYAIVAWRVMYVTYLNRECPDLPCDVVFSDGEWKSVWSVVKKSSLPKDVPSLSVFMVLLASLGGYNNRPDEDPPGPQVVWVGIRRMTDFVLAWNAFGPRQQTCV